MEKEEKNPHAQALGRMNRGKRKTFTKAQLEACSERLNKARKLRWVKKAEKKERE